MFHIVDDIKIDKKIILDSDVLIHFFKADKISFLTRSFKNEFCILPQVREELCNNEKLIYQIDFLVKVGEIKELDFGSNIQMAYEYAKLIQDRKLGSGESACMLYCKYNKDIVGSSNLKDVHDFCELHKITYLTTMDFLYQLYKKEILTRVQCNSFVKTVKQKKSKLPCSDFDEYLYNLN